MITVDEIMATDLYTLSETASVQDAIELMADKHIRHIPIVDAEGKLTGLISQRDVLAATGSTLRARSERQAPDSIPLAKLMTREVATVEEHTSARSAALYLERHRYGCLPVLRDGKLQGIVTDSDFVAVAINLLEQLEDSEPAEHYEEPGP